MRTLLKWSVARRLNLFDSTGAATGAALISHGYFITAGVVMAIFTGLSVAAEYMLGRV